MQLRFASFAVVNSRRDFHPQDRAHAGRTTVQIVASHDLTLVVMLRMHATRPIRKKPEPEWLPCAPRSSTSLRHSRHGDDDLALVIAGAKEPKGFRQIG